MGSELEPAGLGSERAATDAAGFELTAGRAWSPSSGLEPSQKRGTAQHPCWSSFLLWQKEGQDGWRARRRTPRCRHACVRSCPARVLTLSGAVPPSAEGSLAQCYSSPACHSQVAVVPSWPPTQATDASDNEDHGFPWLSAHPGGSVPDPPASVVLVFSNIAIVVDALLQPFCLQQHHAIGIPLVVLKVVDNVVKRPFSCMPVLWQLPISRDVVAIVAWDLVRRVHQAVVDDIAVDVCAPASAVRLWLVASPRCSL